MENREGQQPDVTKAGQQSMAPLGNESANGTPRAPAPPEPEVLSDAAEEPAGFFSPWNLSVLGVGVCLLFFILWKFTFIEIWAICKAVLGLSFVIFIHELGHFLAAKWCGVNVTAFSIGFGPAIPGCWFQWGDTTYKLAVLPLGGYVQMVGQVDGDESSDDADDPNSYRKKTVPQRMLIISAGVIMNAILAVACFIAIYQGPGKEHPSAVFNYVDAGAPAFQHGIPTGAVITDIDGVKDPNFSDFTQMVINSLKNRSLQVTYKTFTAAGEKSFTTPIEPRMDENNKKPFIGVSPSPKAQLAAKRGAQPGPYFAGTPAHQAGLEYGDVIIAMSDPARADHAVTELPIDPRDPNRAQHDFFEFQRRLELLAGKDVTLRVRRKVEKDGKEQDAIADITVKPMYRLNIGVVMQMGHVLATREGSSAHEVVLPPRKLQEKDLKGDRIEGITVLDADGAEITWRDKPQGKEMQLDPERLPVELRQWSDRWDRAGKKDKRTVKLHLIRHSDKPGPAEVKEVKELEWDAAWRFDRAVPFSLNAPMPIPELGLAYEIKAIVHAVTDPNSPLKQGDVVKNLRFDVEGFSEELPWLRQTVYQVMPLLNPDPSTDVKVKWMDVDLKEGQWAHISFQVLREPYKFKKLVFKVERASKVEEIDVPVAVDPSWPLVERGWHYARDTRRVTASDPFHAIWLGTVDTKNRMTEIFLNLRGMLLGRIALTNLGGPLTIAYATYRFASMDFTDLLFFLGLISINLAVVNFLPIPVLDGGHMVFLIYEGIRKKPASETVRIVATYVGLGIILLLMIFVLSLDVIRMFFSG